MSWREGRCCALMAWCRNYSGRTIPVLCQPRLEAVLANTRWDSAHPVKITFDEDLRSQAWESWKEILSWVQYWRPGGYAGRLVTRSGILSSFMVETWEPTRPWYCLCSIMSTEYCQRASPSGWRLLSSSSSWPIPGGIMPVRHCRKQTPKRSTAD